MRRVLFCAIAAAAVIVLVGPAGSASGAGAASSISATLARAQAVLSGRDRTVSDPTMLLRDLAFGVDRLPRAERASAESLLARPGSAQADPRTGGYSAPEHHVCSTHFCVHYVLSSTDAVPLADANGNGVPDWVETNVNVLESLWQKEVVEYGFRPPRSDVDIPNHGPDGRVDVYLADLVDRGILGYCVPERPPNYQFFNAPGYCVLDNDYSATQYGASQTATEFLQVTAAHEFFHAIQFGYDSLEDLWLMEGTAMLMEGQFRPDVADRVNYLAYSALTFPSVPVDYGAFGSGFEYGAWLYWRFLVEDLGELDDPLVIRNVWEEAAAARVDTDGPGPDTVESNFYSLQAAGDVLRRRGLSISALFTRFAVVNRDPASFYVEGGTYDYPTAPTSARYSLGRAASTGRRSTKLRHLASRYYAFAPARNGSRSATLKVSVDLPSLVRRPSATLLVRFKDGTSAVRPIRLGARGNGARRVSFGRGTVRRVVLVLTNASVRMLCNRGTEYSCRGVGRDDLTTYVYRASVH
jgi:hypothetical protein